MLTVSICIILAGRWLLLLLSLGYDLEAICCQGLLLLIS